MSQETQNNSNGGITIQQNGRQLTFNRNDDIISILTLIKDEDLKDTVFENGMLRQLKAKKINDIWQVADDNKSFTNIVRSTNLNDGVTISLMAGSELICRTELRYDYYQQSRLDYFKPGTNQTFINDFPNFQHAPLEYVNFDIKPEHFIVHGEEKTFYRDLLLVALLDAKEHKALLIINNSETERKQIINEIIAEIIPRDEHTIYGFDGNMNDKDNSLAYVIDPSKLFLQPQ
ncbi:MAG: hypothetical protein ACMG57_05645 [Candidatus Dojkabacteria bacterium]